MANPIAKLSIVGEYRYHEQEDNTPMVAYNQVGTTSFTNQTTSREVNSAKLEATYRFPWADPGHGRGGLVTSIDRHLHADGLVHRHQRAARKTDETSWWLQVRRSMTETISGSIRYTRQHPRRFKLARAGVQRRRPGDSQLTRRS